MGIQIQREGTREEPRDGKLKKPCEGGWAANLEVGEHRLHHFLFHVDINRRRLARKDLDGRRLLAVVVSVVVATLALLAPAAVNSRPWWPAENLRPIRGSNS